MTLICSITGAHLGISNLVLGELEKAFYKRGHRSVDLGRNKK